MAKSLVILKPGFTTEEIFKDVFSRILEIGGEIRRLKVLKLSDACLKEHYAHLIGRKDEEGNDLFRKVADYMESDIVIACEIVGGKSIVEDIRKIVGPTKNAPEGTIRGDYALDGTRNVVHASAPDEYPEKEVERFFDRTRELEIEECIAMKGWGIYENANCLRELGFFIESQKNAINK